MYIHHGKARGSSRNLFFRRVFDLPVFHKAHVGARSPHVQRDEVLEPSFFRDKTRSDHAACGTRKEKLRGLSARFPRAGNSAV
jgi:hypothetical protein